MATRVRIHRLEARVASQRLAEKLVRDVLYEIEFAARAKVYHGPYTTQTLVLSIHSEGPYLTPDGITGRVGSSLPYAAAVHHGARPHMIFPHGNYRLRFYWRRAGRRVAFWSVSHPGQPGKHYLTYQLREIARRHNMRVVTHDVNI